jgi:hypothetical protein
MQKESKIQDKGLDQNDLFRSKNSSLPIPPPPHVPFFLARNFRAEIEPEIEFEIRIRREKSL